MNNLWMRIAAAILMILVIAWGYWWLALAGAAIFLFIFPAYYEILLWGAIFDALYAAPASAIFDYRAHIALLSAIVLLFASIFLKKHLAFYS